MASDSAISGTIRAKTSVWWDLEECEVPKGFDVEVIAQNIKTALLKMNYCGPVSFFVYADTTELPSLLRKAFKITGMSLCHLPAGLKANRDKKILFDMLFWAVDNPAPANFLLISGDQKDFSNELKGFDMRGFNILLAHPANASDALFQGAKSVWHWTSLLCGGFPIASCEFHPQSLQGQAQDASQFKWAPHEFLQSSKPKFPAIPIPIMFPQENIQHFNDRLKRQRNIKNNEPQKLFSYKNRYQLDECQPLPEYKSTGVCIALHYLREEMMIPTKDNIQDVIRYGDVDDRNFDVEEALNMELEHDMVVTQNLGDLSLYLPRNWDLWECVNPEGGAEDQYSKATWDLIQNYLSSFDGSVEMIISECRYEACLKLKNSCLRNFRLGRIQQIMNMIVAKGWIWPFPDGWHPVSVTLPERE
ncbi:hypothetical protein POM88_047671 [Heracleum sosnowskyi]|uniref:NYN domain-containing protein n=1 Tax=Heracleum sosnowskyi TaxID=360622 RepID=A0AAD8GUL5_9APIA|nr:hypothetical protein POM88_047671 [Heracleum sosnowskyi]